MPRITSFMLCEGINNISPSPGISIPQLAGPCNVIRPEFIPGNFTFGVAIGISGVDTTKQCRVRFEIKNPKEETVQTSLDAVLPGIPLDEGLPVEYQGFLLSFEVRNLAIPDAGVYKIFLFVDDELIGTESIPVFPRKK